MKRKPARPARDRDEAAAEEGPLNVPGGINPDDRSHTSCKPDNCELADTGEKFEGKHSVFRCPRCSYSTLDPDEAKRLNPDIAA